jgi:hypothetical protein
MSLKFVAFQTGGRSKIFEERLFGEAGEGQLGENTYEQQSFSRHLN